ncbi:MAG: MBL fold metallo-hydrolase [Candidatus Bathyarchaeota archaeon]|nr:MBL fold metallo-hydrolase [Candidatus Bathyarchaeota archaeon]
MAEEKIHVIEHRIAGLFPMVNSFIAEGDDLTLIDTGLNDGSARTIIKKLETLDHRLSDVDLCIITHAHRDHIGGLKALKASRQPFLIAAHDAEADDVEKATGLEVDLRLIDGQTVGGFTVVYLPGHTLGSIALLGGGTLITGDALNGGGAELKGPNPMFSKDRDLAEASVRSLADLDFDRVLVGHGSGVESGGKEALAKLIAGMGPD